MSDYVVALFVSKAPQCCDSLIHYLLDPTPGKRKEFHMMISSRLNFAAHLLYIVDIRSLQLHLEPFKVGLRKLEISMGIMGYHVYIASLGSVTIKRS